MVWYNMLTNPEKWRKSEAGKERECGLPLAFLFSPFSTLLLDSILTSSTFSTESLYTVVTAYVTAFIYLIIIHFSFSLD